MHYCPIPFYTDSFLPGITYSLIPRVDHEPPSWMAKQLSPLFLHSQPRSDLAALRAIPGHKQVLPPGIPVRLPFTSSESTGRQILVILAAPCRVFPGSSLTLASCLTPPGEHLSLYFILGRLHATIPGNLCILHKHIAWLSCQIF